MLDVGAAFSALSLISLLTDPLNTVFHAIPTFASSLACFERIQEFLSSKTLETSHLLEQDAMSTIDGLQESRVAKCLAVHVAPASEKRLDNNEMMITMENVSFGTKKDLGPIAHKINLQIPHSSLTIILGRVGSGKSTILKGMLGEIPCLEGLLSINFSEAAYCAQIPWLLNTTIQQNVVGGSTFQFDKKWYDVVIDACALDKDLSCLPEHDQTVVGSKGVSLSGGQKQRVVSQNSYICSKRLCNYTDTG